MFLKYIIPFVLCTSVAFSQHQNNVCKTLEAYFDDMSDDPDCFYDPDLDAKSPEEIAKNNGLQLERHKMETEDGYILTTFRLKSESGLYGKGVIFLQHGLGTDSTSFMANGNLSIAFFLSKMGFDVWLGNFRSSQFSSHVSLERDNPKYWDFTFHETGLYDLSANFDYIRRKTKRRINYIGHLMGGTSFGIYASMKPEEAENSIKQAVLIAPLFYMRNTKGLTKRENLNTLYNLLTMFTAMNQPMVPERNDLAKQMIRQFCTSSFGSLQYCLGLVQDFIGISTYQVLPEKLPMAFSVVNNINLKSFYHSLQLIESGEFRMFDNGHLANILLYNSTVPPSYDLSRISVSLTLIYGENDYLASKEDILYVYEKFKKPDWDIYGIPYDHISVLFNDKVEEFVFPILLKKFGNYII